MKTFYSTQAGFSLVEVLVAISILLITIVGPLTMITRANNSTSFATEQINAWFLAQEGLELIQKQRDDYMLEYFAGSRPTPWTDFIDTGGFLQDCLNVSVGCGVTIDNSTKALIDVVSCATITDCRLYISSSDRASYIHSGSVPSPFTRVITIEPSGSGDKQVRVTSTVTWRTGTIINRQQVQMVTSLLDVYVTP